jgi:hypothetical protein
MDLRYISKSALSDKTIFYNELQVKHLKTIYKCLLGDELISDLVFKNLNNILTIITNLKNEEVNSLNILDYFLLIFDIRCTSIGNLIFVQLADKTNTSIEINIFNFNKILKDINLKQILETDIIQNIEIKYSLPTINELHELKLEKTIDKIYPIFINTIKINNTVIKFKELNYLEKNNLLEKIPAKITSIIIKKVYDIYQTFNKINLLATTNGLQDKILPFNFNINNLTQLVKILFGEQLMSLYENIFALCKLGNFSPEYIENCTPGEYILFVKKLEALSQQNQKQNNNEQFISDEFDSMSGIL